jgi:RecB family exonuclease
MTPRITRLVRVPDLQAMHRAVASACGTDVASARACAVLVPTRGAAAELRRTLENLRLSADAPAMVLPDLVTRGEFYDRLSPPSRLAEAEREVIVRRAALVASEGGAPAPFRLRPGLIVEILAFYDELRRRNRTVDRFERLMIEGLEPSADIDRGAERLLRLTHFLSAAFREFERRIAETGRVDEHALRAQLLAGETPAPYRHVIVTVADQAADARGLWLADYDLLTRIAGIERLDIISTEHVLASGYHQRIHDLLPGIEEVRAGTPSTLPVLSCPEPQEGAEGVRWFVYRDREEELVEVARDVKQQPGALDRRAVVFQRPLPYLYLARQVFGDAEVPYQALDALPLAAEPFAAALDLVFTFAASEGTRGSIVDLLSSPHWRFDAEGRAVSREDVRRASTLLRDVKHCGGWDRLAALADQAPALRAAQGTAVELGDFLSGPSASAQFDTLLRFMAAHEQLPHDADEWHARHLRARAAVVAALESLRDAHRLYDDEPLAVGEIAGTVRRHIEAQTFAPRTGRPGLSLLDAQAAPYADVDDIRLLGMVESDWPERTSRSIFYPSSLLTQLGWPSEADRSAAARARFRDLLLLPRLRLSASAFTLEDDAIVPASALLEALDGAGLPVERVRPAAPARMFVHEALAIDPVVPAAAAGEAAEWLTLRLSRSSATGSLYHGAAGSRDAAVYAVSHVERYLECPFKYFAAHVLRLPEEREDEPGMTPQERGQFLHDVFETFFTEWQAQGGGAITTANVAAALALFERVAEARLETLGDADRAVERTYLLGSAAASGLAERAFAFEIEQGGVVIERLLEHKLEGTFTFASEAGPRQVRLRAKADRIDLLEDGTLRIIDYKLGKAPKPARALQLPIYAVCAEQHLAGRHGRASWTLGRAGYVAFKEKQAFSPLGGSTSLEEAVAAGQATFLAAIDGIEAGVFPPRPDEPFRCTWCGYSSVCRKDYVGDE